ncbi:MAG: DUF4282 domain-containing protein [Acidimicrobiales bacterium]
MQPASAAEAKGLFKSLYDFNFSSLITTKVIRFVYALVVVVYSLVAIGLFILGLASGEASGVFGSLIVVPIAYLLYLVFTRIWMEFLIVVFRIGEDIRAIRVGGIGGAPPPPPPPPAPFA